jgi:subtilisin family serine protease
MKIILTILSLWVCTASAQVNPAYMKVMSNYKSMQRLGITGKGVKVMVIDTGNNNAPDSSVDFTGQGVNDVYGHGSEIGSIIKSSIGLAPGCILYNLKAAYNDASYTSEGIASALQWAVDHNADIICIAYEYTLDSIIRSKIAEVVTHDIIIFASSGNSHVPNLVGLPSGYPGVTSVSAVTSTGLPFYYNYLFDGAIATHGINICANGVGNEVIDLNGNYTTIFSGTSFSSPWLAGAAAVLKEYLGYPSNKSVLKYILKTALKQTDSQIFGSGIFTF